MMSKILKMLQKFWTMLQNSGHALTATKPCHLEPQGCEMMGVESPNAILRELFTTSYSSISGVAKRGEQDHLVHSQSLRKTYFLTR